MSPPRFVVCELTTLRASFEDDLAASGGAEVARRGHDAFRQLWERAAVQMRT